MVVAAAIDAGPDAGCWVSLFAHAFVVTAKDVLTIIASLRRDVDSVGVGADGLKLGFDEGAWLGDALGPALGAAVSIIGVGF
jgi:hypothetical protein